MELVELVKKAQSGDEQAIHDICMRFTGLVKKYAFQPHIRSLGEDAQAQGWLAVVQGIKHYDPYCGVPFAGYVESCVKYATWNLFKGERRRWQHESQMDGQQGEDDLTLLERLPAEADVAREVELRYLSQELTTAMAALPEKQRLIVLRTVLGEERLRVLAKELGITTQGVYNLRKRGLTRLKNLCAGMYRDIRH